MKNVILLFALLCTALFSKADQLQALTQAQAEKAVGYLKKEYPDGKYYSVVLKGRDERGNEVEEYVDLAYVFVKKGKKAKSLGKVLKFECDPCTKPFDWLT